MPLPIKEDDLRYITKKVYALYAKHGFGGISMDEVSRQTNISKATLYRYFTSKEDIVKGMARVLIDHLDSVQFNVVNGIDDVMEGMREFYVKSIMMTAITGPEFLSNLEIKFPDIYGYTRAALDALQVRFEKFFQQAVGQGCFRDLPFSLVSCQLAKMLPVVIGMDYLEQNRITLTEAIREYYRMLLSQILELGYLPIVEKKETYSFVAELADYLVNEFFIDSIRR